MADQVPWKPFNEITSLRDAMNRLFENNFVRPSWNLTDFSGIELPVDMYQTANDVVVKTMLPGFNMEFIGIFISGDIHTIKGEHKYDTETKDNDYFYKEHHYGSFSISIPVTVRVKSEKA
jgi:HSP20 family protein